MAAATTDRAEMYCSLKHRFFGTHLQAHASHLLLGSGIIEARLAVVELKLMHIIYIYISKSSLHNIQLLFHNASDSIIIIQQYTSPY